MPTKYIQWLADISQIIIVNVMISRTNLQKFKNLKLQQTLLNLFKNLSGNDLRISVKVELRSKDETLCPPFLQNDGERITDSKKKKIP